MSRAISPFHLLLVGTALVVAGVFPAPTVAGEHAFVLTTDYTTGGSAKMSIESPWTVYDNDVVPVCADAIVRTFGNHHYIVNRFGCDNIQVVDIPGCTTVAEYSTGAGSNPQDIMVINDEKAYVTRWESPWLYILHPFTGVVSDSLDIGPYADGDGLPEMSMMAKYGDRVFVQIQRLDRDNFYSPSPPSYLLVINAATDAIEGTVTLMHTNPSGKMQLDADAGLLFVTGGGNLDVNEGGIEAINVNTLASAGQITSEAQLGGDISCGRIDKQAGRGFALVSDDFFFTTSLVQFDIGTGEPISTMYTTGTFVPCIELDQPTNQVFFPDRKATAPGYRVFDSESGDELTTSPIDLGLPPFDITFYREPVFVAESIVPMPLVAASPNPTSGLTSFSIGDLEGNLTAQVFDARGRLVRSIAGAEVSERLIWDGLDEAGRAVATGLYFVHISDGRQAAQSRVVIQR